VQTGEPQADGHVDVLADRELVWVVGPTRDDFTSLEDVCASTPGKGGECFPARAYRL
jgi:hypothetical protein